MILPKFSIVERTVLVVLAFGLFLIASQPIDAVWDGEFQLAVTIEQTEPIESDSLLIGTCWHESEAEDVIANLGDDRIGFRRAELSKEGTAVIRVATSGRPSGCVSRGTYNHPQYLIVEFRQSDINDSKISRKSFPIPPGIGSREMKICLP